MSFADLVVDAYQEPGRSEVLRLIPQLPSEERDQLLQELLRRGDHDLQRRPAFHLLACACLELLPQPSHTIQTACVERLHQLIPPHSVQEMRSLARAGTLALKPLWQYLLDHARSTFTKREIFCLRTLMLIGGDQALDVLAEVVQQGIHGSAVLELQDGWRHFDQETYARRVIAPLTQGQTSLALYKKPMAFFKTLAGFEHFTHLTALRLGQCFKLKDITALSTLQQLEALDIIECHTLKTITTLGNLPNLKRLYLNGCWRISDFTPIGNATWLESLMAFECVELTDLNWLRPLQRLEMLALHGCIRLQSIEGITDLFHLKDLSLTELPALKNTDMLAHLQAVESLTLSGCRHLQDISALATLSNLKYLYLTDCTALRDIQALTHLPQLEIVHLERCYQLTTDDLATLPATIKIIKDHSPQ